MKINFKEILFKFKYLNLKSNTRAIKECDFLLFCHDVDRSISLDNQAYSPLLDSMKDEFEKQGFRCQSIAHPWSTLVGKYAYGEPIAFNGVFFLSLIFKKLFGGFGLRPTLKVYEYIIRKAKPSVIITIGCTDDLCEAARNMNVFHVELLHGIGYTPLPWGWEEKKKIHLPQGLISLDSVSTKTFSPLLLSGLYIKQIQHPFLRRFKKEVFDDIPSEWKPSKKSKKYKKEILVTLQWGYYDGVDEKECFKGILSNGLFFNELEDVISKTVDTVFWHFRFHPVQYRQVGKYKKLFDFMDFFVNKYKNCEWRESTYIPLPSVLSECSGHITMLSMASYDSAYLGIKTLALCPTLRAGGKFEFSFIDLVDKGYLLKQEPQVDSIIDWVHHVEKTKPLLSNINENSPAKDVTDWFLKINNLGL